MVQINSGAVICRIWLMTKIKMICMVLLTSSLENVETNRGNIWDAHFHANDSIRAQTFVFVKLPKSLQQPYKLSPVRRQAITWNRCWFIVGWTPGNKFQWNLNRNSIIFIQDNASEIVVCQNGGHFGPGGDELMTMMRKVLIKSNHGTFIFSMSCNDLFTVGWLKKFVF